MSNWTHFGFLKDAERVSEKIIQRAKLNEESSLQSVAEIATFKSGQSKS